jgi:Family of unknown function (DUF5989)
MKALFASLREGLGTIVELIRLFGSRGRWWLLPIVVVLIVLGLLLLLASATPLGPFIYTLF